MSEQLERLTSGEAKPKARGFAAWIDGRARRREYWMWIAPLFILTLVVATYAPLASLLVGIPMLLAMIRRLHDLGHSGWFAPLINVAINIVAFIEKLAAGDGLIGALVWIAALTTLGAIPGERKVNEYGPPPGKPKTPDLAETFG